MTLSGLFGGAKKLVQVVLFFPVRSPGLLTPFVYLPMRAVELGSTREEANRMILFLGIFNTVSRIATGALADRKWIDCLILHNFGAIVAGVATCIAPVLNSYLLLCVYAAIFGIAIGKYAITRILSKVIKSRILYYSIRLTRFNIPVSLAG